MLKLQCSQDDREKSKTEWTRIQSNKKCFIALWSFEIPLQYLIFKYANSIGFDDVIVAKVEERETFRGNRFWMSYIVLRDKGFQIVCVAFQSKDVVCQDTDAMTSCVRHEID